MMLRIEVEVEGMAFQFDNKSAWIAHAQSWYRRAGLTSDNAICVDAIGRICLSGKEFLRAEAEDTYPIKVYAVQPSRQRVMPCPAAPDPSPAMFCDHEVNLDYPCAECQAAGVAAPARTAKEVV